MTSLSHTGEQQLELDAAETGALLIAQVAAVIRHHPEQPGTIPTSGEAERISAWLAHALTTTSLSAPKSFTAEHLSVWLELVMDEADAWEDLGVFRTTSTLPGIERALSCVFIGESVAYLIAHGLARDDLIPERNRALRKALYAVETARTAVNRTRDKHPKADVCPSIENLDLAKEIADLRAGHGWLPWDYSTSDAALDRVRPHFRSHARSRDRFALANDLQAVKALQDAKRRLSDTLRAQNPVLGAQTPGEDGPWSGALTRRHLLVVQRALRDGQINDTDLDAVWNVDTALTTDHYWWHCLKCVTAARQHRTDSTVQRLVPALALLPLDGLGRLDPAAAKAVRRHVTRHASALNLLLTEPDRLGSWPTAVTPAGIDTIQSAFALARTEAATTAELSKQIRAAVSGSKQAFETLKFHIEDVLDSLLPGATDSGPAWLAHADEIRLALGRRQAAMDQFRIVLFGRTGAGKSSFIEALSRGEGVRISTGEGDFTTTCSETPWGACTLIDTPGIEGWGRQNDSQQLERKARHALDTADLVILAFDTQNQKEGEFRKVARWVLEFDKPVLAVLNVRNPQWRRPDKEPDLDVRRNQALSVADHAQHTQDALSAYGLLDALPVALHGLNAVAARCAEYRGPYASNIHALREKVGADNLERYSNFPVVEGLLSEVLASSALDLRLQSLANDIRHRLDDLAKTLLDEANKCLTRAVDSEQRLEQILTIIGPGTLAKRRERSWRRASHLGTPDGSDLLTELEMRRQQPFAGTVLYGTIWDSWDDHAALHLDATHRTQTRMLEDALRDAFDARRALTNADITELYVQAGMELAAAAHRAIEAVHQDLRRDISAAIEHMTSRHVATPAADSDRGLDGSAGTLARNVARGLNVASLAVVFLPVPGVNILAAAAIRIVGQVLLNLFSKRTRQAAEQVRASELRQALIAARDAVSQMRQDVEQHSTLAIREATTTIAASLRADAQAALTARDVSQMHTNSAAAIGTVRESLPQEGAGSAALAAAKVRLVQDRNETTSRGWRPLALGEDWLTDTIATHNPNSGYRNRTTPKALQTPFSQAQRTANTPIPSAGAVEEWLQHLASSKLEPIQDVARDTADRSATRPSVVLTGPRRVGVSALHSALTNWDSTYDVIDASSQPDEAPLVAGAALVGLVIPPSLFGTSDGPMRHLGPSCLLPDTTNRLVLILNRIDELAIDPHAMPEQLAAATERKIAEVRRYAIRLGLPGGLPVLPVAGAPYGSKPSPNSLWFAGTERLHQAISKLLIPEDGAAASVRTAVSRLDALSRQAAADLESVFLPSQAALQDRAIAIANAQSHGRHLDASLRQQLTRSLEAVVLPLAYDVSGAANKAALQTAQEAMSEWRELDSVSAVFASFEEIAFPRMQEWLSGTGRTITAVEFKLAIASQAAGALRDGSVTSDVLTQALPHLTKLGRRLSEHSEYYHALKQVGVKFRPWQAVRGAQRMIKVTRGLAVLGAAVAVYEMWDTERAEKARNALRIQAPQAARDDVDDLVTSYLDEIGDHPGLGAQVQLALQQLEADAEATDNEVRALAERIHRAEALRTQSANARNDGLALLGLTEEKSS